jgi:integrase
MVLSYLNKRVRDQSGNAYNKDRKNLLAMWIWGRKILKIEDNPVVDIERMPWDRTRHYMPSTQDVLKVMAVATRGEGVFLYSYILTGARRSEIFRWAWHEDINFQRRQYRLGTRKTRDGSMEYQWFEMSDLLYDELWWWWENRPIRNSPYVFVNTRPGSDYGKPFVEHRKFMRRLCERAGVTPFTYQALRGFFASILADERKESAKTIQRLLRHKRVQTTELYIRNLNKDLKASVNGLASFFETNLRTALRTEKERVSHDDD